MTDAVVEEIDVPSFDPTRKKRKKKKAGTTATVATNNEPPPLPPLYEYEDMLDRLYAQMPESIQSNVQRKKITICPPQLERDGAKHTIFTNGMYICNLFHRPLDHFSTFLQTELAISVSVVNDGNAIRMQKRWTVHQVENIVQKYAGMYVKCPSCRSSDTRLSKVGRLQFINCQTCGASRTVAQMEHGYRADV